MIVVRCDLIQTVYTQSSVETVATTTPDGVLHSVGEHSVTGKVLRKFLFSTIGRINKSSIKAPPFVLFLDGLKFLSNCQKLL